MDEELKARRYRVEKTGYGFWPYCVRAGDGTRELFKGHQKQCMVVAAELETAFEDGKFVADRANACQGGEAVEVVAYRGKDPDGGEGFVGARWPDAFGEDCIVERLMTVAQHQRILASSVQKAGEAVATDAFVPGSLADLLFQLGEKGIGVSGGTHGDHWRVTPLYTHPADQVAEGDAELVACLKFARTTMAVVADNANLRGVEYRSLIAEIKRIDAKLASRPSGRAWGGGCVAGVAFCFGHDPKRT